MVVVWIRNILMNDEDEMLNMLKIIYCLSCFSGIAACQQAKALVPEVRLFYVDGFLIQSNL